MNISPWIVRSFVLVAAASGCLAGTPEISIGLNTGTGSTSALGGLEPAVKWQTSGSYGDFDVAGGIDATVKDTDSIPPYSVWGMAKRSFQGFGLSVRGDMKSSDMETVDIDLQCDTPSDTVLQLKATVGPKTCVVSKFKATQTIDALGGSLVVSPTYNVGGSSGDVSIGYAKDNTQSIKLDIDTKNNAKLSLMQKVGGVHVFKPSITSQGQFEMDYETAIDKGKVTTTYKPDHYVNVKWADGPWQANFNAPMDGYYGFKEGVKVSVKTKVDVPTFN